MTPTATVSSDRDAGELAGSMSLYRLSVKIYECKNIFDENAKVKSLCGEEGKGCMCAVIIRERFGAG